MRSVVEPCKTWMMQKACQTQTDWTREIRDEEGKETTFWIDSRQGVVNGHGRGLSAGGVVVGAAAIVETVFFRDFHFFRGPPTILGDRTPKKCRWPYFFCFFWGSPGTLFFKKSPLRVHQGAQGGPANHHCSAPPTGLGFGANSFQLVFLPNKNGIELSPLSVRASVAICGEIFPTFLPLESCEDYMTAELVSPPITTVSKKTSIFFGLFTFFLYWCFVFQATSSLLAIVALCRMPTSLLMVEVL